MLKKTRRYVKRIKEGRLKEIATQILWMYKYLKSNVWWLVLFTALGFSGTITMLISSLVSRDMVDIITGHNKGKLLSTFGLLVGITLINTFICRC